MSKIKTIQQAEPIKKNELRQIDYAEFGSILNALTRQVKSYQNAKRIHFDCIVAVLRSGAFTACHLASKLRITTVLPVQYKYLYEEKVRIIQKFKTPRLKLNAKSRILIVDTNCVFGKMAVTVAAEIQKKYPDSDLYYAAANLDYSFPKPPQVKHLFYGRLSNESRNLSLKQAAKLKVSNEVIIFPWENFEDEWKAISATN